MMSFWKRFLSIFNIFPDSDTVSRTSDFDKSDSERIQGDFEKIGDDLRNAIDNFNKGSQ